MAYDGVDKMSQMWYISIGYLGLWLIGGTGLAFYVRSQTKDAASKSHYTW